MPAITNRVKFSSPLHQPRAASWDNSRSVANGIELRFGGFVAKIGG
jgi:hypothetical protein